MHQKPLNGKRIVITRPAEQSGGLIKCLRSLGAEPIACPAIAIAPPRDFAPLDGAIRRLPSYDWVIFTSVNGVQTLLDRMEALRADTAALTHLSIGAIGPATAAALVERGLQPSFMPTSYMAEAIVAQIGDVAEKRILLPRADIAPEALAVGLRGKGAIVEEVAAYRTVAGAGGAALAGRLHKGGIDAITFTSSSTVRSLLDGLESAGMERSVARTLLCGAAIFCIGPVTAATAREEGLRVDAVAREYTVDGLVETLVGWFAPER